MCTSLSLLSSDKQTFDGTNIDSFDAHQVRQLLQDDRPAGPIVLVYTSNLALYPVRPVQIVAWKCKPSHKCLFFRLQSHQQPQQLLSIYRSHCTCSYTETSTPQLAISSYAHFDSYSRAILIHEKPQTNQSFSVAVPVWLPLLMLFIYHFSFVNHCIYWLISHILSHSPCLQCFDDVGWAAGTASGL